MSRRLPLSIAAVAVVAALGLCAVAAATGRPTRPTPVVVQSTRHGFDWGDAAIGAGVALGLVLALAGVLFSKGDRNAP
jgi:hypothetical protein